MAPKHVERPTVDELRAEIRGLAERRARGDLGEKAFRKRALELSVELARTEARSLVEDEEWVAEHHVVHSHFRLTESLMREPEQTTVSYFATKRRLVRVRGTLVTGRPPLAEEMQVGQVGEVGEVVKHEAEDPAMTKVDAVAYDSIKTIERRVEWRWGEVGMGAAIVLAALLFHGALAITGPVLVLLGVAGALHGLLMPTRWSEIIVADPALPPLAVHGPWRRSGRRLLAVVTSALRSRRQSA